MKSEEILENQKNIAFENNGTLTPDDAPSQNTHDQSVDSSVEENPSGSSNTGAGKTRLRNWYSILYAFGYALVGLLSYILGIIFKLSHYVYSQSLIPDAPLTVLSLLINWDNIWVVICTFPMSYTFCFIYHRASATGEGYFFNDWVTVKFKQCLTHLVYISLIAMNVYIIIGDVKTPIEVNYLIAYTVSYYGVFMGGIYAFTKMGWRKLPEKNQANMQNRKKTRKQRASANMKENMHSIRFSLMLPSFLVVSVNLFFGAYVPSNIWLFASKMDIPYTVLKRFPVPTELGFLVIGVVIIIGYSGFIIRSIFRGTDSKIFRRINFGILFLMAPLGAIVHMLGKNNSFSESGVHFFESESFLSFIETIFMFCFFGIYLSIFEGWYYIKNNRCNKELKDFTKYLSICLCGFPIIVFLLFPWQTFESIYLISFTVGHAVAVRYWVFGNEKNIARWRAFLGIIAIITIIADAIFKLHIPLKSFHTILSEWVTIVTGVSAILGVAVAGVAARKSAKKGSNNNTVFNSLRKLFVQSDWEEDRTKVLTYSIPSLGFLMLVLTALNWTTLVDENRLSLALMATIGYFIFIIFSIAMYLKEEYSNSDKTAVIVGEKKIDDISVVKIVKSFRLPSIIIITLFVFIPLYLETRQVGISLLMSIPFTLITFGGMLLNDIFDEDKDKISKPYRPLASGIISRKAAFAVVIISFGISFVLSIIIYNRINFLLWLSVLVLIIGYNWVIKYAAYIKTIITAIMCCISLLFIIVNTSVHANIYYIVATFFFIVSRELLMDIRDQKGDSNEKINTLPIIWGERITYIVSLISLITSLCILTFSTMINFKLNLAIVLSIIIVTSLAIFTIHPKYKYRSTTINLLWIPMFLSIVFII